MACKVSDSWSFDLDDARAEIGQLTSAKGCRDGLLQTDDGDAGKRRRAMTT